MINILCWNIRGVRSRGTLPHLKYLLNTHNIDMLVLLEPLANHTNLEQVTKQLKFCNSTHGGHINSKIWVFWREHVSVDSIIWHEQHFTCNAAKLGSDNIKCTFVYAKCRRQQRFELWESLTHIADDVSVPWLIGGDFNVVTMHNEKKGIHPPDVNAMMDFNNFIMRAGLSDAGYTGHDYTWCNHRLGDETVWERLDRFLINGAFISTFSIPKVTHLPRATSDHCPLLFETIGNSKNRSRFHFNRMWIKHPSFRSVVECSWEGALHKNPLHNFALKLKRLRNSLKKWNWEVFGDQQRKEKALFQEVSNIEGLLQSNPSTQLERDLKFKKAELEDVLHTNECMARDKARVSWLKDGNRNTAFFHAMIKARRVNNKMTLTQSDGTTTTDPDIIGQAAVEYFTKLFNGRNPPPTTEDLDCIKPYINETDGISLTCLPSEEEVHNIITNMNHDSSPGPDGFSVPFYSHFWSLIKYDLMQSIYAFFQGHQFPSSWSATIITLIPKSPNATSISNMRPISLCNVSHKIISRILSSRLSKLLPAIISEEQSGFIKGRLIHSNLALAHDLTTDLHKKGQDNNLIIKLDMSKAYDRISWSYLIRAMRKMGFNEKWCDLIFRCISNGHYSVHWQGQMYGYFTSSRGVRQGDPLSSSLFILVMEWFSRSINTSVFNGTLKTYYTSREAVPVTHLLYADDILIFTKDCQQSTTNLMSLLDKFSNVTGQSINQGKSAIFFSKHTSADRKALLLQCTQFTEAHLPTKYLGAPLIQGRVKIIYFDELLTKLKLKIDGWMRNLLSFAGRITLVQSVLNSMSLHVMTVLPVPKTVLHKMESLIVSFLWDHGSNKRFHWIRYDLLCRPKDCGGLGIRKLDNIMLALHSKLAWEFLHQSSLWARYANSRFTIRKSGSAIWNSIQHLICHLREHVIWDMGNGSLDIKSWCALYGVQCPDHFRNLSVREVFENLDVFEEILNKIPADVRSYYRSIRWGIHPGRIRWLGHSSGDFTANAFLKTHLTNHPVLKWAVFIWQNWFPPNTAVIIWKLFHGRLSTDDNIKRIGIPISSICHCCRNNEETMDHLFFKGTWARHLWRTLANAFDCDRPLSLAAVNKYWMCSGLSGSFSGRLKATLACLGLAEIWRARNDSRHDKAPAQIVPSVRNKALDIIKLMPKSTISPNENISGISLLLDLPNVPRLTLRGSWKCWDPGARGICLNIAVHEKRNRIKGACLFRSYHGKFTLAVVQTIEKSDPNNEILHFLDLGLQMAQNYNIQVSIVQGSHPDLLGWKTRNKITCFRGSIYQVRILRILPMINQAASALLYTTDDEILIHKAEDLPLHVLQCIKQDALHIPHFCPTLNYDQTSYGRTLDDIIYRKKNYKQFRDDIHFM